MPFTHDAKALAAVGPLALPLLSFTGLPIHDFRMMNSPTPFSIGLRIGHFADQPSNFDSAQLTYVHHRSNGAFGLNVQTSAWTACTDPQRIPELEAA